MTRGYFISISDRKKREREFRRLEILTHARALITEKGLDAMTMQDVAERAELSKATIYTYFKSREEILFEIRNEAATAFFEYAKPRLKDEFTGIEMLRALWQSYLGIFGESNDILICIGVQKHGLLGSDFDELEDMNDPTGAMLQMIEECLERGINDGTILSSINPKKITKLLLMITTTVVQDVTRVPEEMRNSKRIASELQNIFELILRGLASDAVDKASLTLSTPIDTGDL